MQDGLVYELDEAERLDAAERAAEIHRFDRLGRCGVPHESFRGRAEQRLARESRLLKPHGDIDRAPGCELLAGGGVGRDYFAGVDRRADLDGELMISSEVGVQPGEGFAQLTCRSHRTERVVLVQLRDSEDRHGRVSDELLERAPVALHDRAHRVVVAAHHAAHDLGVEPSTKAGRIDDVREEDRDGLPAIQRLWLRNGCDFRLRGELELPIVAQDRLLEPL